MRFPIAIVDDDTIATEFYSDALHGLGYAVQHFKSPDSCFSAVSGKNQFALFVCDLMMQSYGRYSRASTNKYMTTGLLLIRDIRSVDHETPIILFTNLNIESILNQVKAEIAEQPNVFVVRKSDYPPHELAEAVDALLSGKDPFTKVGVLRRLWNSLVLEPKVFGMGIDIKKLSQSDRGEVS